MNTLNLVLCAVAAASLDICALVLILTAYQERNTGKKRWNRMTSFMELADYSVSYPLDCDEILIGRHASADIRLPDLSVSRYHAIMTVSNGVWTITDIGSKSGIFVNGNLIKTIQLRENDVIKLGNRRLVFRRKGVN
ncbi:MAG: FHA domain-containing protein [Ruminococcus sp.]|nr:FHA domain-containing protein [Ruminococcus sp.]MBQ4534289.1 FHA domain-containing protein [Ruminococcus sp.]MBR6623525.1 FHA domain-containing protein [Ruminococcus sp.]